ncbi:MAG: hypothetical protein EXS60_00720 [Candidatus Pacebacteria bacterium]|nr:hypothetical protein [Candidatus Paceibacterota bacterium]
MSLLKGGVQERVSGLVHHTHPLNDERCQAGFLLDEDEWQIEAERPHGEVVLIGASDSPAWKASLVLWVPMSFWLAAPEKKTPQVVAGLTHCANPLCPALGQISFPLNEYKIVDWNSNGQTTLHSSSYQP